MTTIREREGIQVHAHTTTRKARIPIGATLTSLIGMGPIPLTQVINAHALVAEANSDPRDKEELTQMETVVRSRATRRAQRRLDKFVTRTIEPLIRTIKAEHAEINLIDQVLEQLPDASMMGPTGEQLAPAEASHTHNMLRERIAAETCDGSKKHLISGRHPVRDIVLLALDFPVFLFAMLGLLNVKLISVGHDFPATLKAGIATLFAILGTVLLAVVMRRMGRRHRTYKGGTGGIDASGKTITLIGELVGVIAIITIAATVMASRVYIEGLGARAHPLLIAALASLFAILIGFSAYINYRSEFDNGSPETDRVQHLSLQIRARENQIHGHQNARKLKVEQAGVNTAKLNRAITTAHSTAAKTVISATSDRAIHLSR